MTPQWNLSQPLRFLHVIRDPLETIISSYHYHKAGKEAWTKQPLGDRKDQTACVTSLLDFCTHKVCDLLGGAPGAGLSLEQIFLRSNLEDGLYFSYLMFKFCRFPEWEEADVGYKSLVDSHEGMVLENVPMEWFHRAGTPEEFSTAVELFVDALGIPRSSATFCALRDRANPLQFDKSKGSAHSTSGTYDLGSEKRILLEMPEVCLEVQKWGRYFDYKWEYSEYCS